MKIKDFIPVMGKLVIVEKRIIRTPLGVNWTDQRLFKSRVGWFVGIRWLPVGEVLYGNGYDVSSEFVNKGPSIPCVLVCFWPTYKPIRVPMDGFRLPVGGEADIQPHPEPQEWSDKDKAVMRQEMKDWPRDKDGRWIKKGAK